MSTFNNRPSYSIYLYQKFWVKSSPDTWGPFLAKQYFIQLKSFILNTYILTENISKNSSLGHWEGFPTISCWFLTCSVPVISLMFLARKLNFCMSAYVGVTLPHIQVLTLAQIVLYASDIRNCSIRCTAMSTLC